MKLFDKGFIIKDLDFGIVDVEVDWRLVDYFISIL